MNDRHPSGSSAPTAQAPDGSYGHYAPYDQQGALNGHAGYDGYSTGTFDSLTAAYDDSDPLFGALPGSYGTGTYSTGTYGTSPYDSGQYDTSQWGAPMGSYDGYDAYGAYTGTSHETGSYDTSAWGSTIPQQGGPASVESLDTGADALHATEQVQADQARATDPGHDTTAWATGSYDFGGQLPGQQDFGAQEFTPQEFAQQEFTPQEFAQQEFTPQEFAQQEFAQQDFTQPDFTQDTGQYDAAQWDTTAHTGTWDTATFASAVEDPYAPSGFSGQETYEAAPHGAEAERTAVFEALDEQGYESPESGHAGADFGDADFGDADTDLPAGAGHASEGHAPERIEGGHGVPTVPVQRRGAAARGRRRTPVRRSAMLTVAVPSVAVMGVAGIAAASVSGGGSDEAKSTQAAPDPSSVKPAAANSKLDSQLATLTADADDFADRASRTQERLDLKQRQLEEKKRKEAEAARKEALRPKFALPVDQDGLSAYYGQAGINWMSVHTGIDFPVSYGTPVMAATDGTVRTQWDGSYGNMAIVTAPDGTETWYCHLSSTKIRSGTVKAGTVIAYSGNSGNSTGPHLHFEVHPGGGSAVDPLPWLRSHGLDPS
ncbi:M23 family metallopeptidase [Streptomyces sp. NPDC047108]|uniref:M23 family metallopeptidase n=1 Tax=Streptomyces sp. NPDC047108 TaxID=3155025 RepID=UPI0033D7431A